MAAESESIHQIEYMVCWTIPFGHHQCMSNHLPDTQNKHGSNVLDRCHNIPRKSHRSPAATDAMCHPEHRSEVRANRLHTQTAMRKYKSTNVRIRE